MSSTSTLLDFIFSVKETTKKIVFSNGRSVEEMSYADLYDRACNTLFLMQKRGLKPGDEVVFQVENNSQFVVCFWACLLGGAVPVPLHSAYSDEVRRKFSAVVGVLESPFLLSSKHLRDDLLTNNNDIVEELKARLKSECYLDVEYVTNVDECTPAPRFHNVKSTDLAFIQFSSGSTGTPKGVMLTHGNLVANIQDIIDSSQTTEKDVYLSWMPLTHDLGIIGFHLAPIAAGIDQVIIPTAQFVRNPLRWLESTSQYRASVLASPNFGYKYTLQKLKSHVEQNIDLSCVRLIVNGAEPISYSVFKEFESKLAQYGLKEHTVAPFYGLAEACVLVSASTPGEKAITHCVDRTKLMPGDKVTFVDRNDENALQLCEEGFPAKRCEIKIADENGEALPELTAGCIFIRGLNVTQGYYRNPEASAAAVYDQGWVRTGDLGFMCDGRLVVCGREKDVIFVNGQNFYAHDLEHSLEAQFVQPFKNPVISQIVAVGITGGDGLERVLLFLAGKKQIEDLTKDAAAIKRELRRQTGIDEIVLVPVKRIPKTTSGKIQRFKLSGAYFDGEYDSVIDALEREIDALEGAAQQSDAELNELGVELLSIAKIIFEDDNFGPDTDFFAAGGDSLKLIQLSAQVETLLSLPEGNNLSYEVVFENSTIRTLSEYLHGLQSEQSFSEERDSIQAIDIKDGTELPLSAGQESLWLHQQLNPESSAYNVFLAVTPEKRLQPDVVEGAYGRLLKQFSQLSVRFIASGSETLQRFVVNDTSQIVQCVSFSDENQSLDDFLSDLAHKPFVLEQEAPARLYLIELADGSQKLLFVAHHIVMDFWSLEVLLPAFFEHYQAEACNADASSVTVSGAYAQFIQDEKNSATTARFDESGRYWSEKLAGDLPKLDLPLDYVRPAIKSYQGHSLDFTVSTDILGKLRKLASDQQVSLFNILMSAYQAFLFKLTGQEDVIVGTPIALRENQAISQEVGYFVNMLSIRSKLNAEGTFIDVVHQVKQDVMASIKHRGYPYASLLKALGNQREASSNPVFQTSFSFESSHTDSQLNTFLFEGEKDAIVYGNRLENHHIPTRFCQNDMDLMATESQQGLHFSLRCSTSLFKPQTARTFCEYFQYFLGELAAVPKSSLNDLKLIGKDYIEKTVLTEFNAPLCEYPREKTILDFFNESVERRSSAIAVRCGNDKLTYKQLDERANQIAYTLINRGIKAGHKVALLLYRTPDMIASLLAVIKAGAAYVPIDPDYPQERIQYTLNDSQATIILTHSAVVEKWSDRWDTHLLERITVSNSALNIDNNEIAESSKESIPLRCAPGDLAYIIYTSGTTGRPKGAMLEHRNVVRLFFNDEDLFDFSENDVWTMFHSYCFDFSVWEIYGALLFGGELIIVPKEVAKDPRQFLPLLSETGTTILNQTPSAFYNLVNEDSKQAALPLSLRMVVFGGEALNPRKLAGWQVKYPNTKLINMYGITETTVHVTYQEIDKVAIEEGVSNIGRAIPTLNIYVMDEQQRLLPPGVAGELCVSGEGVCRGYLNREDLTRERFLADPHNPGCRMYRSGDLARWRADGTLEYLGRMDAQVQLRGFRIELGEVESALATHPQVEDVVVLVRQDENEHDFLCAYYIAAEDIGVTDLRQQLSRRVPDYMIPSYFVRIASIPLNPNGKVDVKELPTVEQIVAVSQEEYVAPVSAAEKAMAEVWQEVLHVEKVGLHDNFFELGGDSVKAIQITSAAQKKGYQLNITHLFEYPRLQELAECAVTGAFMQTVETVKEQETPVLDIDWQVIADDIGVNQHDIEDIYPLSPLQQGFVFLSVQDHTHASCFEQFLFRVRKAPDMELIQDAWQKVILRHDILRTAFYTGNTTPLQVVFKDRPLDMEYLSCVDLAKESHEEWKREIKVADEAQGFDIVNEPLIRFKVLHMVENEYRLMLSFHHAIMDGWSLSILLNDFFTCYYNLELDKTESSASPLPLKEPIAYKTFINWMDKRDPERSANYWQEYLEGYDTCAALPQEPARQFDGDEEHLLHCFQLDREMSDALRTLAYSTGVSLYSLIQAVWGVILCTYNDTDDVVVGSVVSGRSGDIADVDRILGLFINSVPARVRMKQGNSFTSLLKEIQMDSLSGLDHHYYPLSEINNASSLKSQLFSHDIIFDNYPLDFDDIIGSHFGMRLNEVEFYWGIYYDFGLNVSPGEEEILFRLIHNPRVFSPEALGRIEAHLRYVIEQVTKNPNISMEAINVLPEAEKQFILQNFNDTEASLPPQQSLLEYFMARVMETPQQMAISYGDQSLTYADLNQLANTIAQQLIDNGVSKGDLVPIMVQRSLAMMAGIIAIQKVGAAYVPVDPKHPESRINYILSDSAGGLLLTHHRHDDVNLETEIKKLYLDDIEVDSKAVNPDVVIHGNDLAYVIYTSGSTGNPKGTLIEHQSLVNRLNWMHKAYPLDQDDTILQKTPFTFDVSVWELFLWMMTGSRLHFLEPDGERDPEMMINEIAARNITAMHFVPSMLDHFLLHLESFGGAEKLSSLKYVVTSGEELKLKYAQRFQALFSEHKTLLANLYGPTEATIDVSFYDCHDISGLSSIPIGKPIDNTRLYILSNKGEKREPSPIGVTGELCIGGINLARGYLNREELTREKFVATDLDPDGRIYRTGDLARWLPDGNIEYLGRLDFQVKIRGVRIELGEIENCLLDHPQIKEAVVVAQKDKEGDSFLCAYYISDANLSVGQLRAFSGERLPDYMIPAYFVPLKSIPLSANGKTDRKALPDPQAYVNEVRGDERLPNTEYEQLVEAIWKDVLNLQSIGVYSNFFDVGGDSIKSIQIVARLKKAGFHTIKIADVFAHQTIADIAQVLEQLAVEKRTFNEEDKSGDHALPVADTQALLARPTLLEGLSQSVEGIQDFYAMTSLQEGLFFYNLRQEGSTAYHEQLVLELDGHLDAEVVETAWNKVVERHDILRTRFSAHYDYPVQVVLKNAPVAFTHLTDLDQKELTEFIARQKNIPYNLESDTLLRIAQVDLTQGDCRLVVSYHHILLDGWSVPQLIEEFFTVYQQLKKGVGVPHLERPSFKHFIHWLDKQDDAVHREYWQQYLEGYETLASVPEVSSALPEYADEQHVHTFTLPTSITTELADFAMGQRVTLNTVIQLAWAVNLGRYNQLDDVVFGSTVSGRPPEIEDVEAILGLFLNTIPVRVNLAQYTVTGCLQKMQAEAVSSMDHHHYSLAEIQGLSSLRQNLFDHVMVFENHPMDVSMLSDDNSEIPEVKSVDFSDQLQYQLAIIVIPGDSIEFSIYYDPSVYSPQTLCSIERDISRTLAQMLEAPQSRVKALCSQPSQPLQPAEQERVEGAVPLLPIQDWFLHQTFGEKHHYNQSVLLNVDPHINIEHLQQACEALLVHHDALRAVFSENNEGKIQQRFCSDMSLDFTVVDMFDRNYSADAMVDEYASLQAGINLTNGPLIRFMLVRCIDEARLFIVAHHLVVDNVSWSIILEDLLQAYRQANKLETITLPQKSHDYCTWVQQVNSGAALLSEHEVEFWREQLYRPIESVFLSEDINKNTTSERVNFSLTIDEEKTQSIIHGLRSYSSNKVTQEDLVLAIMLDGLNRWNGVSECKVDMESHGRTDVFAGYSVHRTVGWFTAKFPVVFSLQENNNAETVLKSVADIRQVVPRNKLGAGIVENSHHQIREPSQQAQILFNYLGNLDSVLPVQKDSPFSLSEENVGANVGAGWQMAHALEVNAFIKNGCLTLSLNSQAYSADVLSTIIDAMRESMLDMANVFQQESHLSQDLGSRTIVAPRNETETTLVEIWQRSLSVETISIDDDFFEIGGDSLKLLRVINQLHSAGIKLEINDFYEWRTIRKIADNQQSAVKTDVSQLPNEEEEYTSDLLGIHHWMINHTTVTGTYNVAWMLHYKDELNTGVLLQALHAVMQHHPALRTRLQEKSSMPVKDVRPSANYQLLTSPIENAKPLYAVFDVRGLDSETRQNVVDGESLKLAKKLSAVDGPLLAMALFRDEEGYHLFFCSHHLALDNQSMIIVFTDLLDAYHQLLQGEEVKLPENGSHIKEIAAKVTEFANSSEILEEVPYWEALDEQVVSIPVDKELSKEQRLFSSIALNAGQTILDADAFGRLQKTMSDQDVLMPDALMAAWAQAMKQQFGTETALIEANNNGRFWEDFSLNTARTVGWLVHHIPLVVNGSEQPLVKAAEHVRSQFENVPHMGRGYQVLNEVVFADRVGEFCPNLDSKNKVLFIYNGESADSINDLDERVDYSQYIPRDALFSDEKGAIGFPYAFIVLQSVTSEGLQQVLLYQKDEFTPDTIESLIANQQHVLRRESLGEPELAD